MKTPKSREKWDIMKIWPQNVLIASKDAVRETVRPTTSLNAFLQQDLRRLAQCQEWWSVSALFKVHAATFFLPKTKLLKAPNSLHFFLNIYVNYHKAL
jgi:hypothetical protein